MPRSCCSIGQYKGCKGFVEVVAKHDQRFVFAVAGSVRRSFLRIVFLNHYGMITILYRFCNETIARCLAPRLGIAGEACICGYDLDTFACLRLVHRIF